MSTLEAEGGTIAEPDMELFPLPTTGFWPLITAFAGISVSILASSHAILYKRDSRAVVGWVGVIWLVPVFGAFLYVLFGINRVNRRVAGKRGDESAHISALDDFHCSPSELLSMLPGNRKHLLDMYRLGESVTGLYLLKRNTVHPLVDGDEAYPA
ncbi:MAG: PLDc N-terminal domain-containing protein, partial [Spirochaetota bacterium]